LASAARRSPSRLATSSCGYRAVAFARTIATGRARSPLGWEGTSTRFATLRWR
jgi:nitrogen fixation protein FixH